MSNTPELSRRKFLKTSLTAAGALALNFTLPVSARAAGTNDTWKVNAWLELDKTGQLTFILDKVEMGQGTMTGLTTLVAEELSLAPERIHTRFAPPAKVYRNPAYKLQMTGGSTSIASSWQPLRKAAATMRELLRSAASDIWDVSTDQCTIADGMAHHPAHPSLPWEKLIDIAADTSEPWRIKLKPASEFRYIGQQNQRTDSQAKSFGQAGFGIDTQLPGMVFATMVHAPYIGGRLKSLSAENARASAGVIDIFAVNSGIAVVAKSYWQAVKAARLVEAEWQPGPAGQPSTDDIFALYKQALDSGRFRNIRDDGNLKRAQSKASTTISAEYQAPFLAHATMEPQNCVAWFKGDNVEVWAPTQAPDLAQVAAARAAGIDRENITVHTTFLGGGFGRRILQDFVEEAVEIAKQVGKPVKLIWSREDDTRNDYYRPAALHRLTGSLDEQGVTLGWHHQISCPTLQDWLTSNAAAVLFPFYQWNYDPLSSLGIKPQGKGNDSDHSPWEGADTLPYEFPALKLDYVRANPGIPVGYWRSVGNSHNAFAIESFVDELAHAAGQDPLAYRRSYLQDTPLAVTVLNAAAKLAGWGKAPAGRFQGLACHMSFGTWVAQVVEVSVSGNSFTVEKVYCALHCGTVVNPEIVKAQVESGIIYGLTAALHGEITLKQGTVEQSNFHDYPALRIHETPAIEVEIIASDAAPTGVGEPGLPPLAPALANALFAATGQRLRKMPLKLS